MTRLLLVKKSLQASRRAVLAADTPMLQYLPYSNANSSTRSNAIRLLSTRCHGSVTTALLAGAPTHFLNHIPKRQSFPARRFSSAATVDDHSDSDGEEKAVIPFLLADIGEGIKEVELLQWFVQEGDQVQQFDRICEVQSDKATVEITSRYDGVVVSLAGGNVGGMVQVGSPLLQIRVEGAETVEAASPQAETKSEVLHSQDSSDIQLNIPQVASQFCLDSDDDNEDGFGAPSSSTRSSSSKFLATPAVRKLAMEHNLDLSTLVGTGPRGRVLKSDALIHLREIGKISSTSSQPAEDVPSGETPMPAQAPSAYLQEDETVSLKGYNRLMIQTMSASRDIPHMGFTDEFDVTKLTDFRKEMSPKVSILAFLLKATSLALKEYPIINASWKDIDNAQATVWTNHNIGVAMDTPRGLVVPVVRNCQDKSLLDIQEDLNVLKEIAAAGKLGGEHLTGATFTLSNIGSVGGGTYMNPLIAPPQAAIGAMGALQTLPRFDSEGEVTAAKIINVSWAGDHRMIDGATLARFSNLTKQYLQEPIRMLTAMK